MTTLNAYLRTEANKRFPKETSEQKNLLAFLFRAMRGMAPKESHDYIQHYGENPCCGTGGIKAAAMVLRDYFDNPNRSATDVHGDMAIYLMETGQTHLLDNIEALTTFAHDAARGWAKQKAIDQTLASKDPRKIAAMRSYFQGEEDRNVCAYIDQELENAAGKKYELVLLTSTPTS